MANLKGTPASKKEISWYSCIAAGHSIQIQKNETQKNTRCNQKKNTRKQSPYRGNSHPKRGHHFKEFIVTSWKPVQNNLWCSFKKNGPTICLVDESQPEHGKSLSPLSAVTDLGTPRWWCWRWLSFSKGWFSAEPCVQLWGGTWTIASPSWGSNLQISTNLNLKCFFDG